MRKKISLLFLFVFIALIMSSCGKRTTLLFLNWGEYVDEAMIEEFEQLYNCDVVLDLTDSNEKFYAKVSSGTTCYDVVCPSDYMVEKMYDKGMLREIDFERVPNYDLDNRMPGIKGIAETLEERSSGITNYYVPYLWGTWGIMYSTLKDGLEEAVTSSPNSWSSLFDRSVLPSDTSVAMYNSHLHDYYVICKYLGLDYGKEFSKGSKELELIYSTIKNMKYDAWGTDDIKKDIVAGNRDLGFMWTGDFLYYYCENAAKVVMNAYLAGDISMSEVNEMLAVLTGDERVYKDKYQIGFDIFIPDDTIAFCDNFIIPKDAMHYDLALEFINFMCGRANEDSEIDPAFSNTYYVSYNTPFMDVYDDIVSMKDIDDTDLEVDRKNPYDSEFFWSIYDRAIGIAFEKYYPKEVDITLDDGTKKTYKGDILEAFSRTYIDTINQTFNDARANTKNSKGAGFMTYNKIILVIYIIYLVVMSCLTFFIFRKDKKIASGGSNERIKEKTLLEGVVLGGAIGGFAGRIIFHHKTNKKYFSLTIYLGLVLQIAVLIALVLLAVL